jgi:oligopeptide/dipeptide ABC transporter ATP-binding protein
VNDVAALEVEGLAVQFAVERDVVRAVSDVSFSVAAGETVAIVGESGSGKTVTALAVMGLIDRPGSITRGDVRLAGRSLVGVSESEYREVRGRDLAMVFQDPMTSLNPVMRVGDQIAEAIAVHGGTRSRRAARAHAVELLGRVGITPAGARAREYPHQLSGGMRQRVMVAMALANGPQVLIADEPTTALDVTTQAQILELLGEVQREMGLALVLVTHDLGVVAGLADRVVVMYAGRVVEEGPVDAVFGASGHPYTRGLLASVPRRGDTRGELVAIPGTPPDPARLPSGCAFHPRCPLAEDRCREEIPELRVLSPEHRSACLFAERVSHS